MPAIMKVLLITVFVAVIAQAVDIRVENGKVIHDGNTVDLSTLQIIKDTPFSTTYELRSGNSVITITKSKTGDSVSVTSYGAMSPDEIKNMENMQKQIGDDVNKNIKDVETNIKAMNQRLEDDIKRMNENMNSMFSKGFPFN